MSSAVPILYHAILKDIQNIGEDVKTTDDADAEKKDMQTVDPTTTVIVSGREFHLSEKILLELPYFSTLLSGRFETSKADNGVIKTDQFDPNLLQVIIDYLSDKKIYKLFGVLPKEECIFKLLQLFDYLTLSPPIDTEITKVQSFLLEPPYMKCDSQEDISKLGFALFYAHKQINWKYRKQYRNSIYNYIMYIFNSDKDCFQARSKYHLKQLALKCVTFSLAQFQKIKAFSINEASLKYDDYEVSDVDEMDSSFDEENFIDLFHHLICYDSDSSDFFSLKYHKYNYFGDDLD